MSHRRFAFAVALGVAPNQVLGGLSLLRNGATSGAPSASFPINEHVVGSLRQSGLPVR